VPAGIVAAILVALAVFFATRSSGETAAQPGTTASVVKGAAGPQYQCAGGDAVALFYNANPLDVTGGGTPPTFNTNGKTYCLDQIQTYHWNNGAGAPPGQLWLQGPGGKVGPFQAQVSPAQGGVMANWYAYTPHTPWVIINGTYTCMDSDPASWSANKASGGEGFCQVWVREATPIATPASATAGK
jgi:hypothetical protein